MYGDNTLTPREAIRLCALGTVAEGARSYEALVTEVRHFASRISGPSLDLMGESIELLRYEGLVEMEGGETDPGAAQVSVAEAGMEALRQLLKANLRAGDSGLNALILALKFRFLHFLSEPDQDEQLALLIESCETDLARLEDLARHHGEEAGFLAEWLAHQIELGEARQIWLEALRARHFARAAEDE